MLIKPGKRVKVEIHLGEPPVSLFTLVRMCDSQQIQLDAPTIKGKKAAVPAGTQVVLVESSREGLLIVESQVREVSTQPLPVWIIPIPGLEKIQRIQRRRNERFLVDLHVRWKKRDDREFRPDHLHMIDINPQGAYAMIPENMEVGDEFYVDLTPLIQISGQPISQRISPLCKIVRKVMASGEGYGFTFSGMEREVKSLLNESIRRLKSKAV